MNNEKNMISVKNLHKKFKSFHALKGIDLNVRQGEIYGFIGQNGAGKSTTMNILAGLSRPHSGTCLINGLDVTKINHPSELSIGYLPEDPKFYPWLSAVEMLQYLDSEQGRKKSEARIHELLEWVGLKDAARRRTGGFSRGMKQRLGLCAALIHDPQLLILDEPSSALDPEGRSDVLRLISELKSMNKTVLFSTHILSDVERICDTVGMISEGKMIMEKPLKEIQQVNLVPVFEIVTQKPCQPGLPEQISQLPGILDTNKKLDNQLSVTVQEAESGAKALINFFSEKEIALSSFSMSKNSLEDIFIQEVNGK